MGQHKYNPTAIAAKEGKIPPKPPNITKAEIRRMVNDEIKRYLKVEDIERMIKETYMQ